MHFESFVFNNLAKLAQRRRDPAAIRTWSARESMLCKQSAAQQIVYV
jgi:hypothetical protein